MEDTASLVDSRYAWLRLAASVTLAVLGGVGVWSIIVIMPAVQAEFGSDRAGASLPYTFAMIGFVIGGILMGRMVDRVGIIIPLLISTLALSAGFILSAFAPTLIVFALIYGVLIGFLGSSALFGPLVADVSFWFNRRRGIAIALCASGNYFAGTIWPPAVQYFAALHGWRATQIGIGIACLVTMLPLLLLLRRPPPREAVTAAEAAGQTAATPVLGLPPNLLQACLMLAGISCCVAMSMPQVHIVAYCVDLGYGSARGAEMLSVMLGFGIVSRLASGWILDRVGGFITLLLGSTLQALSLTLYLPFDGLVALYVIAAVFGVVQGGIVPSYAFIVREVFPPAQAGLRVSLVLASSVAGMALGGWMSGAIFDLTGSYRAAMMNGIAWNILNMAIALWLLLRWQRLRTQMPGATLITATP